MDKRQTDSSWGQLSSLGASDRTSTWETSLAAIAHRFNKDYRREPFALPPEVEAMPIFRDWASGALAPKLSSPFWQLAQPKKNQRVLDLGCGVSFLIYPWRDWEAYYYGQDISVAACDLINARGPQLNSKLFKGVKLGAAHQLDYEPQQFDLVVATGFSCYYEVDYWSGVMAAVKRVLKPDGVFVFDVLDPDAPGAENWAILETYLGAEVFLASLVDWQKGIKEAGAKLVKQQPGELFQLCKIKFGA